MQDVSANIPERALLAHILRSPNTFSLFLKKSRWSDALKLLKYKRNKTTHKNKMSCKSKHSAASHFGGSQVRLKSLPPFHSAAVRAHQRTGWSHQVDQCKVLTTQFFRRITRQSCLQAGTGIL